MEQHGDAHEQVNMPDSPAPENGGEDIQDILKKLDISDIPKPDREIGGDDEEDTGSQKSGPLSRSSSISGFEREIQQKDGLEENRLDVSGENKEQNGEDKDKVITLDRGDANGESKKDEKIDKSDKEQSNGKASSKDKSQRKSISPLKFLKRLTSKDSKDDKSKPKLTKLDKLLKEVTVESLPQVFIVKYMGVKKCAGLWGIQNIRGPLEELVGEIQQKTKRGEWGDLPLLILHVSPKGIYVREHKANKSTNKPARGLVPIEFISYGVQDIKYTRVFSFILVREISSRNKQLECHSYVCDSTITARKLALSMSLAFKEYASSLKGKPYRFQVDLRPTKELEEDLSVGTTATATATATPTEDECEA